MRITELIDEYVNSYAPVILFVYSRLESTLKVLNALKQNTISQKTDLIIFSDAARSSSDISDVKEVRKLISEIDGFKSITVNYREKNFGLANNIIDGVTSVINSYGKAIVLEDDIVTSPYFLEFMNLALDKYQNNKKVWHISGWNYPIETDGIGDAFFWRLMNCWGWATWADRWQYFNKNPQQLIKQWNRDKIKRFNLDGVNDTWNQVIANKKGKLNTWAVFWYATIFEADGLCLNATQTLVNNIGFDGTGENCSNVNIYNSTFKNSKVISLPNVIEENKVALNRIKNFYLKYRRNFIIRFLYKLKKRLLG